MVTHNDDFDGYRKWLNITSTRRPPTHYELLGIKLDEDDHEVIEAAVEQRRNYVESKRGKGHDDLVSEILMRIDEAGITVLNSEMRRDYDRQMELFEKRRKNRRVDPNATSSRFESRPGTTVGEEPVIVKTFAGIMAVICLGFGIMAWFSFQLPWSKKIEQVETTPIAPVPIAAPAPLPQASAAVQSQPAQAKVEDSTQVIASVPAANVAEDAQWTYLVTLPRIDLREYNGWWSDKGELILGGVGGQPINRKSLVFEGQHSVHGIYMHARPSGESFITFRLGGRFESFVSKAHIPEMLPNQGDPRTPLVFKVVGDGRSLWQSDPLAKKGDHQPCKVSVKGINDLSLKIECPGPDNWALASWIEPHLLVAEKETTPSSVPVPRDDDRVAAENVMNAGGSLDLLIDGKKVSIQKGGVLPNQIFRISRIDLKDVKKVVDHDLEHQPRLDELRELILMATSISDATFQPLTKYRKLVDLNVAGTAVKGSGFRHLRGNESLEILLCGGCPITDNNLVHLKSCNRLSVLGLIDTKVTDAGLDHLRDIATLKELRLNGTRVTDKGIQKLTTVKGLTKLSVGRTKVTPAGVNSFKKALPTCEVQLQ